MISSFLSFYCLVCYVHCKQYSVSVGGLCSLPIAVQRLAPRYGLDFQEFLGKFEMCFCFLPDCDSVRWNRLSLCRQQLSTPSRWRQASHIHSSLLQEEVKRRIAHFQQSYRLPSGLTAESLQTSIGTRRCCIRAARHYGGRSLSGGLLINTGDHLFANVGTAPILL